MFRDLGVKSRLVDDIEGDGGGERDTLRELLCALQSAASCTNPCQQGAIPLQRANSSWHTNGDLDSLLRKVVQTRLRNETASEKEDLMGRSAQKSLDGRNGSLN